MRFIAQRFALIGFFVYVAVFPGSTITVALDRVPEAGIWFGGALLLLQGAVMLLWLAGRRGWLGLLAGLLVAVLGFAVEYAGVITGFPFGRYVYTEVLQPQVLGVVPLPITCAWVMAALSSYEIAARLATQRPARLLLAATLILLLDLQIETVATRVNSYWIWQTAGPYYDVPTANFIGWWLTGLGMAWVLAWLDVGRRTTDDSQQRVFVQAQSSIVYRLSSIASRHIPVLLYLMSTLMFTVVNFAYGYTVAGVIGALVLAAAGALTIRQRSGAVPVGSSQHRISG